MSKFIPENISESAKSMGGSFLKAADFEGDGLVLQCEGMEKVKSNNPKFGANDQDTLYKQEILDIGDTFRYSFKTQEGENKTLESKSTAVFIAFNEANLENGEWVRISKTGKMDETRYNIERVDAPKTKYPQPEDVGVDLDKPPF